MGPLAELLAKAIEDMSLTLPKVEEGKLAAWRVG